MSNLALNAALDWSKAHASRIPDPVEFGNKVALAYLACRTTEHHAGDEQATAASLAALSVRPEVLQAIALLASLNSPNSLVMSQRGLAGTEEQV